MENKDIFKLYNQGKDVETIGEQANLSAEEVQEIIDQILKKKREGYCKDCVWYTEPFRCLFHNFTVSPFYNCPEWEYWYE